MLFNTHILLGITLFIVIKDFFKGGNEIVFFLLVLLGSIFPDIDSPNSKINQWSGFIGKIVTLFANHRGVFHSLPLYLILFFLITFFWSKYYASALFIGYLAHIIGDGITRGGVKIFYPFSFFKIRGPVKVGGYFEWVIFGFLIIIIFLKFF